MTNSQSYEVFSIPANADLSANQYFIAAVVDASGEGQAALCGDGAQPCGVIYNNPDAAGKATSIAYKGIVKVKAGGAITAGNTVASDAAGEAVVATTGDVILGIALDTAVDGDIVSVLLSNSGTAA